MLRSISFLVSFAVVESFRMMPSAMEFSARNRPIRQPSIALIGIYFHNWLFCMTTEDGTIRKKVGIIDRSRRHGGGQNKTHC